MLIKKSIVIFIFLSLISVHVNAEPDKNMAESEQLFNKAQELYNQGRYSEAGIIFEKSAALGRKAAGINPESLLTITQWAISSYDRAGNVNQREGKNDTAREYYKKALDLAVNSGIQETRLNMLSAIGESYRSQGIFDQAMKYYDDTISIARQYGNKQFEGVAYNNKGLVYEAWGQFDSSLENFKTAVSIFKSLGNEFLISVATNNIGNVHMDLEKYSEAVNFYNIALDLDRKNNKKDKIANRLANLAIAYTKLGDFKKSIEYNQQALALDRELGREEGVAGDLANIASLYTYMLQHKKSIEYDEQALEIYRKLDKTEEIARRLHNIGVSYNLLGDYNKAIKYYNDSIVLKENLRKTATGSARRDYLAKELLTYRDLIDLYIRTDNVPEAYRVIETSRAKVLSESLAQSDAGLKIPSIADVQKGLEPGAAVLVYANVSSDPMVMILITKNSYRGLFLPKKDFVISALKKYDREVRLMQKNLRGIKVTGKWKNEDTQQTRSEDFNTIISFYRGLLLNPEPDAEAQMHGLSSMLYNLLISPVEKDIEGIDELVILPDDILSTVPFETFTCTDEKYLIEKKYIRYSQSIGVTKLIEKRKYKGNRKPLIAFGGALYNSDSSGKENIENTTQLENLQQKVDTSISQRGSVSNAYKMLGVGSWENLPGTKEEVKGIAGIVKGTDIYTDDKVSENAVKNLSKKGLLSQYQVIHFATHGLVVPLMPELSAIVLSQFDKENDGEDGYLRMGEIAQLSIKADFVDLSACETGLGKIYGGEGVVGLTQSFLIAGANSVSVSLWQVEDESTMKFMIGLYTLANVTGKKGLSFDRAMTEMKRNFIRGAVNTDPYKNGIELIDRSGDINNKKPNKYSKPFYWAPFIYYGIPSWIDR